MGNAVSNASGDEEELENGGGGAGPADPGTAPARLPHASDSVALPVPSLLLEQSELREAAARLRDAAAAESLVARHHTAVLRWLEERVSRSEETVSLEQFCEMLESRAGSREECEEAFAQFDAEGDGVVDVESMVETLKTSSGANLKGELSHVIRQLQACSLTPGFIDIFSKSRDRLGFHSSKILRFLHRNRISSTVIPFPILECSNNICTMRLSVLKDYLDRLLQKENEYPLDQKDDQGGDQVKPVPKCYTRIEASSNSGDIDKMLNGETSSFWQSDGSARSHWIRLRMKPDVVLRHLSVAVAANDQSYMPQQITVVAGRSPSSLQEVREIHIPSNITGYVTLLENANVCQQYVQINVKRCLSDGCDTRLHGLRAVGYQKVKKLGVSVSDASAIWYLSLLTSLVTASMETNPTLAQTVLKNTQKALQHMPPLSLTSGSIEFPSLLSPNVLEEVDSFLVRIASCCATPEVDLTLLSFALARGSVAKVISSLCTIIDQLDTQYKASSLISSMVTVRQSLLFKYGKPLHFTLQACDVKGKDDKSGPENLLVEPWTGDGFLTETGKTRASVILSAGTESTFQITEMRIKVRKGAIGAQCGLIFAYNLSSQKFHAEEHFKRFEKYDKWKLKDFRQFLKNRSNSQGADLGEDDPVGWFELEDEWDEVDVRMKQCRTTKYLMVKFLCTRQDTAERLGVQGLSTFGYLRPVVKEMNSSAHCLQCKKTVGDTVCGMTLLLKTLQFIQQLTLDLEQQKQSRLGNKTFLDLSGLDLPLFWNFYSKLQHNSREECVYAQTLLLQVLQSCFSALTGDSQTQKYQETAQNKASDQTEPAQELYQHLCEVVDNVGNDPEPANGLKEEVIHTLVNGAAIFFPNRHTRKNQLFSMMKNITNKDQPQSVYLTFRSLCTYFSEKDPGGLLMLPEKETTEDFDISQALSVMDALLLVSTQECKMLMTDATPGECSSVLSSLFWAIQGSLLSWCFLQLKGSDPVAQRLARSILVKYIEQFLTSFRTAFESLLCQYSGKEIIEKLSNSVFAIAARQLMTFMLDFCILDIPHCTLLQSFSRLTELLKNLCTESGECANKVDAENWNQVEQPIVLCTWTMESSHNYENNCHEMSVFFCMGASYFEVEFDDECKTEKRFDYLEFMDTRGVKVRYDTKVGTEKWPKKVTFKGGPRLQFLFHSDNSYNEWGYKFSVTAYGLPDIPLSWGVDLQLLVARLMGRLASRTMALKSTCELNAATELPPAKVTAVLGSVLWKSVFRHEMYAQPTETGDFCHQQQETKEAKNSHAEDCRSFLLDLAKSDLSQDIYTLNSELLKGFLQACKKQPPKTDVVAGSICDQAVNATFAALVYLCPDLYAKLRKYVSSGGKLALSDDFSQVYSLADGIRIWMLEMKQKFLMTKGNTPEDKQYLETSNANPETLAKQCIEKSLLLLKFLPPREHVRTLSSDNCEVPEISGFWRRNSIKEADFQASNSPTEITVPSSPGKDQVVDPIPKKKEASSPQADRSVTLQSKPQENGVSQPEDPTSPPPTPTRKPFNRGRLRLLSFRSIEETKLPPSVKERYPILKNILDFIKDQSFSHESVVQVLALRKAQAQSILKVLHMVHQCLESLAQPHCFQPSCVIFLLELLACQKDFTNYFGHLEGCGVDLHKEIRESYYQLVLLLVNAVKGFSSINDRSLLPALSCIQTCLLHHLDMSWEPRDLSFFVDIKLPDLLLSMSQENISIHDNVICQWNEFDEVEDYKQNLEWMDECQDGMFETWYEKIAHADPDKRRKMHMFIARYCDLLNVEISCDGCDKIAPWHRYRCLQCNDMDLCKTCFLGGVKPEGHEDDHEMVNMEYACDHCQGLIIGRRINCNVCDDFDLCYGCYFAKKYSDSHLPTHSITVYPMVTIRISDRQRLIQPYVHNYSWLLFSALALYCSDLASEEEVEGERLDPQVLSQAKALQAHCMELIADCLVKAQQGKSLRASALLSMWTNSESSSETEATSVSSSVDGVIETVEYIAGNKTTVNSTKTAPLVPSSGKEDSKESVEFDIEKNQHLQPKICISEAEIPKKDSPDQMLQGTEANVVLKAELSIDSRVSSGAPDISSSDESSKKQVEDKPAMPSPEQVFAECSQERILGLLAAMLPMFKSGSTVSLINLEQILPLMFQVVISNAGHLNETYHLTLGLVGKLILRLSPAEVDAAVAKVLSAKRKLLLTGDGSAMPEGWKTIHLLFSLGAVCLDSRVGLDWACSMAEILRELNACPQWHDVIASFTDHCIKQLPFQLKRTNIFTLLVLVGFPEVLCMGTSSVYMDSANEPHNVIILKHFTEKNRAVIIDVKTRKRKTVKDYQLIHQCDSESDDSKAQLTRYLQHFSFIVSHLLQANMDSSFAEAVEATWVLSLALKGLYKTIKNLGFEEIQATFLQSGLLKLLVKKCSKGTGFSKTWLLRDLEILSIMLYSSKKEISSLAEQAGIELEEQDQDKELDRSNASTIDLEQNKLDPLEGLDEATRMCFLMTHDALDTPLHILRAMYELQMKRTDSFFQDVQKRFDGNVITTDEKIQKLAQKWQPSKNLKSEEQSLKAVDTDMVILLSLSKPEPCEKATEESNPISQKLITNTESDLQLSYAKQRRTKSSVLLHKELDSRSKKAVRDYLYRVNEATAVLYARHVLASLLADWPDGMAVNEEILELSGPSHMTYILDMLMQLEEKSLWEKMLQRVLHGCSAGMLGTVALTACHFMEEPGMAGQVRESKHPYKNNTNFEDKVHVPGAIYLTIKFDPQCHTEEGCDELLISSSRDFMQDRHSFSGSPQKWTDFELPGDTLYYRFTSDMSNTEWGYKFTVTAGHRGRFQTGFEILKQMMSDERLVPRLPLSDIWEWQVGVACRQTGQQRLKAIHLLLKTLQCSSLSDCNLTLLRPLWQVFTKMENHLSQDVTSINILLPLHRALTELFFLTENRANESGHLHEYLLALTTDDYLQYYTAQALKNIAAISLAINYPNKSTTVWSV
ncbi:zinc finger ZZ-type and EF-hand domain-containing protein 1 isoform X2 [Microcaecilia unicolor]|uniref:Zinc finger ZZ-type and EF-hand domain-containing protein 1 isoform X2 n=1 Tax=Microcaecilia unicolor TaxID=1415580 RepID=A0A6P7WVF6_9AMPH|nr:zinc finger ZZ-type and EF-hand domain-containing protein 1 isoform X2 [Microcaecilia unicolor]